MMSVSLFCVLVLLAVSGDALKWKQCGTKNYVLVNNVDLTPQPIKMPGKAELSLDVNILKELTGSDVEITIKQYTWLGWIRKPCIFEVGSCTYKDTCTLMHRMMSENWGGFLGPIITQLSAAFNKAGAMMDCPLPVQHIKLDKLTLDLPKVPSYMAFEAKGEYSIKIHTKDKTDGKSILCLEWEMTRA